MGGKKLSDFADEGAEKEPEVEGSVMIDGPGQKAPKKVEKEPEVNRHGERRTADPDTAPEKEPEKKLTPDEDKVRCDPDLAGKE